MSNLLNFRPYTASSNVVVSDFSYLAVISVGGDTTIANSQGDSAPNTITLKDGESFSNPILNRNFECAYISPASSCSILTDGSIAAP